MSATFEQWVEVVFDHPTGGPEWYWDESFDARWNALALTDELTVAYLARLFDDPSSLERYTLEQVAAGIWFLIGESSPAQPSRTLVHASVAPEVRADCVRAIPSFFRLFVAPAAAGLAEHDSNPFHTACYMWWDVFPSWGGPRSGDPEIHRACLDAMAAILEIPNDLCQLSALHGLNHWHLHHAREVEEVVDRFLRRARGVSPGILAYARVARDGCAQ